MAGKIDRWMEGRVWIWMKWWLPVYKKPKRVWEWRGQNHYHEACELEKRSNHTWPGTKLYSIDQAHFQQQFCKRHFKKRYLKERKKIPQLPRQQSWPESPTCYSHFSTFSRSHLFLQNNSRLCLQFLLYAFKKCLQATKNRTLRLTQFTVQFYTHHYTEVKPNEVTAWALLNLKISP